MKIYSKCGIEKSFDDFHRNKNTPDGYSYACIKCLKLRSLELKKNPLMQLEKQIRSSVKLENKLLRRENKKLCTGCKEIFLIDDLVSGVICKECNTEYGKEYYEKNKEKMIEYSKEYREKNKEKIRENERYCREKNKEKNKEYQREYRLKKKLEKQNNT